jgi:hypothetical protein
MTASYTFDVFFHLHGYGAASGNPLFLQPTLCHCDDCAHATRMRMARLSRADAR